MEPRLTPPGLVAVLNLDVVVEAPIIVGDTAAGSRRVIPISGGTVSGEFSGRILPGGADFQLVRTNGVAEIEARYVIETDAGELVYVTNSGLRHGAPEVMARLAAGEPVDPALVYFRTVVRFETASSRLSWLNRDLFVGSGARRPDRVELTFFRLT